MAEKEEPNSELCALVTHVKPQWIEEILLSYEGDTHIASLQSARVLTPEANPEYTLLEGPVRYKGRILVGAAGNIKTKILQPIHESDVGGHSGIHTS